jgi:hypothetical protein
MPEPESDTPKSPAVYREQKAQTKSIGARRSERPVDRIPWLVWLGLGSALLVIGILTHASFATRGGPIMLGIISVIIGLTSRLRQRRRNS